MVKESAVPDGFVEVSPAVGDPATQVASALGGSSPVDTIKETLQAAQPASEGGWLKHMRWSPTSEEELIESERRLLTLIKTPYKLERVNIGPAPGSAPSGSWLWNCSASNDCFINTVTLGPPPSPAVPVLVMLHGYGASQGFYFRNFDDLAKDFHVMAIDQLGWGGSSRPTFNCKSTEEAEAWFVESLEAWRCARQLEHFVLLGHSFGGYVAARYSLKYPERVQHLVLVGPAGFAEESEAMARFRSTVKGRVVNTFWQINTTPQSLIRTLGWWGPRLVLGYTSSRFGTRAQGLLLSQEEAPLFTDYMYHTLAARPSGELCLRHIFSIGAFAKAPLIRNAAEWKVATTFCYGVDDWMDYEAGRAACQLMPVQTELLRIPKAGHYAMLDNAPAFHAAVLHACRHLLPKRESAVPCTRHFQVVPIFNKERSESSSADETNDDVVTSTDNWEYTPGRKFASNWKFG